MEDKNKSVKVNKWDRNAVKNALDDAARKVCHIVPNCISLQHQVDMETLQFFLTLASPMLWFFARLSIEIV